MTTQQFPNFYPTTTPTFSLRTGLVLVDGGTNLCLESKLDASRWLIRNLDNNVTKMASEHAIYAGLFEGKVHVLNEQRSFVGAGSKTASAKALRDMENKKEWIVALRDAGVEKIRDEYWIVRTIEDLARGRLRGLKRYSIFTLAETERALRRTNNDWTQVIPNFEMRGGRGIPRIDSEIESIIKSVIQETKNRLLDSTKHSVPIVKKTIIQEVRTMVKQANVARPENPLTIPGESTIARRIDQQITAFDICASKNGLKSANKEYRQNSTARNTAQYALLVSEYDDIDSGVFLIDDRTSLPFGRGYITHGVCQNTLLPLGYAIGHESRSYDSAMRAIVTSLLPKDLSQDQCEKPWIGYGWQGEILLDNATYNKSREIKHASEHLNLLLCLTRPYGATEKCVIEHYNFIVKSDFCPNLPGFRGEKDDPDAVKRGIGSAILTVRQFRAHYLRWVTGVYQNKPGKDGYTSQQRWEMQFRRHSPSIRWSHEQLALLTLRSEDKLYSFRASGGLMRLGLVYDSDELNSLRKRLGSTEQVPIYYDSEDLFSIRVKSPYQTDLLRVDCVNAPNYARGLTNRQQKLILKIARDRGCNNPSIAEMVKARKVLTTLVEQDAKSTKLRLRQRAKRTGDIQAFDGDDAPHQAAYAEKNATETIVMTELEYSIHELESIDALDLEEGWA